MAEDLLRGACPKSLIAMNQRLVVNEPKKKGKWRRQGAQGNLSHLSGHFNKVMLLLAHKGLQSLTRRELLALKEELEGTAVRSVFTLEHVLELLDGGKD